VRADLAAIQADLQAHADETLRESMLRVWTMVERSYATRVAALWQDWHELDPDCLDDQSAQLDAALAADTGKRVLPKLQLHMEARRHRLNLLKTQRDEVDDFIAQALSSASSRRSSRRPVRAR
jgi:hypothetical protein